MFFIAFLLTRSSFNYFFGNTWMTPILSSVSLLKPPVASSTLPIVLELGYPQGFVLDIYLCSNLLLHKCDVSTKSDKKLMIFMWSYAE